MLFLMQYYRNQWPKSQNIAFGRGEFATVFAELLDTTDFPEEELADFAEEDSGALRLLDTTSPIDEEDSSLTVTGVPSDESPHAQNTSKPTQKRKSNLRKCIIIQPSINIHQNKHPLLNTTKKNYNSTKRE